MSALLTLLLQVALVVGAARATGGLSRRLGQPRVVGEMAAGILLGPSLLGWIAPALHAALFPAASLDWLGALGQVGLLLFMFQVGLEFDPGILQGRGRTTLVTSQASIAVPFALGAALAVPLYPRVSDPSVPFTGFALFLGAAMSVTAFPVLARILTERGLTGTRVGALALACAAVNDVSAWTILALVVSVVRSDLLERPLWFPFVGTAVYAAALLWIVRPALARAEARRGIGGRTRDVVVAALILALLSAWTTEWIGVHALFGAFAMGAVMPRSPRLVRGLTAKLEGVTLVLFLPLFFASTGLRTSVGLVEGDGLWLYGALILAAAVAGKLGGSAVAARATGLPWREALALGALMNTRGLIELVILSVGLELGVISPALFTLLVLMALLTTAMAAPLLEWIYPERLARADREGAAAAAAAR